MLDMIDKGFNVVYAKSGGRPKSTHIEDKKKARSFLDNYKYSSYLDYLDSEIFEGKILNKIAFPEYFETVLDFRNMIREWLNFKDEDGSDKV